MMRIYILLMFVLFIQISHMVIASEGKQSSFKANTYELLRAKALAMIGVRSVFQLRSLSYLELNDLSKAIPFSRRHRLLLR